MVGGESLNGCETSSSDIRNPISATLVLRCRRPSLPHPMGTTYLSLGAPPYSPIVNKGEWEMRQVLRKAHARLVLLRGCVMFGIKRSKRMVLSVGRSQVRVRMPRCLKCEYVRLCRDMVNILLPTDHLPPTHKVGKCGCLSQITFSSRLFGNTRRIAKGRLSPIYSELVISSPSNMTREVR